MGILKGRKALITGCNRGLGRRMLELFASEGADIVACSRHRDDDYRADMESVAGKHGVRIFQIFMDLADAASVREALREVGRDHKDVSVLVNNAGIAFNASFFMTPPSKLRELFEVDFFSQVEIMQSVARLMMRKGRGSIINIASAGAVEGGPGY
ncbi:MAG: SDR family NAD(P)-dependent oxidoreductase, partial [Succinivibrio sp.]